jgi:hypothetical protein
VLTGASRLSVDLLTVFEAEEIGGASTGRVARERFFGGDTQGTMDNVYGELCQMSLPAAEQYRLDHSYAAGVLQSSHFVDPCAETPVLAVADFDVQSTGSLPNRINRIC